jgi:Calcium binding
MTAKRGFQNIESKDVFGQRRKCFALALSQLVAIDPDESTTEAIGDWHYWVAQGYLF